MPCIPEKHYFHQKCIENWIKRYQKCPLCRATVAEIEESDPEPLDAEEHVLVRRSSVKLLRSESSGSLDGIN